MLRPLRPSPFPRDSLSPGHILVRFLLCPAFTVYVSRWYVRWLAAEIAQGVVVLPRSPLQVFVRLEESTVAHCPSLSPVSAPFPRNARHFLPFLSPSVPSSLFLSCYSLCVCTLAVCSLFRSFGPRKYHLPLPPILSNHGRSFIRETDDPKGIF